MSDRRPWNVMSVVQNISLIALILIVYALHGKVL